MRKEKDQYEVTPEMAVQKIIEENKLLKAEVKEKNQSLKESEASCKELVNQIRKLEQYHIPELEEKRQKLRELRDWYEQVTLSWGVINFSLAYNRMVISAEFNPSLINVLPVGVNSAHKRVVISNLLNSKEWDTIIDFVRQGYERESKIAILFQEIYPMTDLINSLYFMLKTDEPNGS